MGQEDEPKVGYGNADINDLIAHLRQEIGHGLDGSPQKNRRYAWLLLNKWKKEYPNENVVEALKAVISVGVADQFYGPRITDFTWLYYNIEKVANLIRRPKNQQPADKLSAALKKHDERMSRERE